MAKNPTAKLLQSRNSLVLQDKLQSVTRDKGNLSQKISLMSQELRPKQDKTKKKKKRDKMMALATHHHNEQTHLETADSSCSLKKGESAAAKPQPGEDSGGKEVAKE